MKKRFLLVSTIIALSLGMVACGGKKEEVVSEDTNVEAEVEVEEVATEAEKEAEAVFTFSYEVTGDDSISVYGYSKEGTGTVCEIPAEIDGKKVTEIDSIFRFEDELTKVVIPDTVTEIGRDTFNGASSIEEIVIPSSVVTVGDSAFFQCGKVQSLVFGGEVTYIGPMAFSQCTDLKEVHFGGMVENEEVNTAFYDMPEGFTIYAPAGSRLEEVAKIENVAFQAE